MSTLNQTNNALLNEYIKRNGLFVFTLFLIVVSYTVLLTANRTNELFPLISAIAFPSLLVSPFLIVTLPLKAIYKAIMVGIVLLILVPFLGLEDTFYLELGIQIAIFATLALGLNIVVGLAGLLDLGYIAFFAVGAYLWGVFTSSQAPTIFRESGALAPPEAFYVFMGVAIVLAALAGILLGLPVLRLKGDYLAIVTLGFGEMIRLFVSNLSNVSSDPKIKINITNGAQGLPGIASPPIPQVLIDFVSWVGHTFSIQSLIDKPAPAAYQLFFYFLVLLMGAIIILLATRLENSPIGRAWTAIREDETAAIAMGVPLVQMKLLAFATGAAFAGAMGVIYSAKFTFVDPSAIKFEQSILILVIVIVGGMGSIRGVLLGGVIVMLLKLQILANLSLVLTKTLKLPAVFEPVRYENLLFGLLLVLMMIFRPAGILPAQRRRLEIAEKMGKIKNEENLNVEPTELADAAISEPEYFESPHDKETPLRETGTEQGDPHHAAKS